VVRPAAAYVAVAFACGILAAEYAPLWLCGAVGLLVAAVAAGRGRSRRSAGAALLATVFLVGAWRYNLGRLVPADDVSRLIPSVTAVQGTVASDPDAREGRVRFAFRVDRARLPSGWARASGRVLVSVYQERRFTSAGPAGFVPIKARLEYGARLRITSSPYRPSEPTNPTGFSWKGYLARNEIYSCVTVRDLSSIRLLAADAGNPVVRAALGLRHVLTRSITRLYPPREASVIAGMVLGTYAYLPDTTLRSFSRTGTLHLLAASGYNCWVLVFLAAPLLRLIRIIPKWRGVCLILALIVYLLMVGDKPSLVRAAVMASLVLIARPLRRVPDTTALFFVAGLVILAVDPANLFDVGFQLSFLAVWGIIYVSPIIGASSLLNWSGLVVRDPAAPRVRPFVIRKLGGALGATAVATLAVTLVTAPVIAYYFNYLSFVSVPANMVVELGVPAVFAAGFACPVAVNIGCLAAAVGWIGTATTRAMLWVVDTLGALRWSAVSTQSPGTLAMLGYYLILFAVLQYVRARRTRNAA